MRLPGGKVRRGPCGFVLRPKGELLPALRFGVSVGARGSARSNLKQRPTLFAATRAGSNSTVVRSGAGRAALPYVPKGELLLAAALI